MRTIVCLLLILSIDGSANKSKLSPANKSLDFYHNASEENLTIIEVLNNGKYLVLNDNSRWEIDKPDRDKVSGWLGPADVKISRRNGQVYPYTIYNQWTRSSARARKLQTNEPITRNIVYSLRL